MVLNNASTSISFRPLVSFDGTGVDLYVEHKPTKTTVSSLNVIPTIVGTKVTLVLPSLVSILQVANNLDELNVRVIKNNVMLYEYMAYWIVGSVDENRVWKTWTNTAANNKNWITL